MRFPGDDESKEDTRSPFNKTSTGNGKNANRGKRTRRVRAPYHLALAALGELGIYALRLETSTGAQQS